MARAPDLVSVIPGDPVAQGRPKATVRFGRATIYDPKKSKVWKAGAALILGQSAPSTLLAGPLAVRVTAVFRLPKKYHSKRNPVAERRWHDHLPDLENVVKAVFDAATGVWWEDDRQVVHLVSSKKDGLQDEQGFVKLEAWRL